MPVLSATYLLEKPRDFLFVFHSYTQQQQLKPWASYLSQSGKNRNYSNVLPSIKNSSIISGATHANVASEVITIVLIA